MRHIVVGTAGHIDHGKTALVRALTGIDTDRLAEEKRRGITIELGFAPWQLDEEHTAIIVDVPGHERFVDTMVAGAGGIDFAILVIAADDGVMPQTREHLHILDLLDVPKIVVALSKCDIAPADVLPLVEEDVLSLLEPSRYRGAAIIRTAATSSLGLAAITAAVKEACATRRHRPQGGPAYLPIDRCFLRHGFGVIAAGTLLRGEIAVGDSLSAFADQREPVGELRIRGLVSAGEELQKAAAGMRVAMNLSGKDVQKLRRGMVLATCGVPLSSSTWIAKVRLLPHTKALGNEELLVHLGTTLRSARVLPLGSQKLRSGEEGPVLLRLSRPAAAFAGQRLVLRRPGSGSQATVAGGELLDPQPPGYKGSWARLSAHANELAGTIPERLAALALAARSRGLSFAELQVRLPPGTASTAIASLQDEGCLVPVGSQHWVHTEVVEEVEKQLVARVEAHAAHKPQSPDISQAALLSQLPNISESLLALALERASGHQSVSTAGDLVRRYGAISGPDATLLARIEDALLETALTPPFTDELCRMLATEAQKVQEALAYLRRTGRIKKVATSLHYLDDTLAHLEEQALAALKQRGELSASDFKEVLGGISRKWAIPLLEYFDQQRVTVRVGNVRRLHASRRG